MEMKENGGGMGTHSSGGVDSPGNHGLITIILGCTEDILCPAVGVGECHPLAHLPTDIGMRTLLVVLDCFIAMRCGGRVLYSDEVESAA